MDKQTEYRLTKQSVEALFGRSKAENALANP